MIDIYQILLFWPDEINLDNYSQVDISYASALIRCNRLPEAEVRLLALLPKYVATPSHLDCLALLAIVKLTSGKEADVQGLLDQINCLNKGCWQYRWIAARLLIQQGKSSEFDLLPNSFWQDSKSFPHLAITRAAGAIIFTLDEAAEYHRDVQGYDCLEVARLDAVLLFQQGDIIAAYERLSKLSTRASTDLGFASQLFEYVLASHQMSDVVPVARQVLDRHGEHPNLLNNIAAVKLFQRQPGFARRCALLLSAWNSVGLGQPGHPNQVCSYEQCGNVDWLDFLHPAIWSQPLANQNLTGNLVLHLASIQSSRYKGHVNNYIQAIIKTPAQYALSKQSPLPSTSSVRTSQDLSIVWISSDFTPHPVSRFLQHFFQASLGRLRHSHVLASLVNYRSQSNLNEFQERYGLPIVDLAPFTASQRVSIIRNQDYDIAVDLSGWTGGHFFQGFLARLAPVQINYLGYFASTGLPTTDFWLGDHTLFPPDFGEWHTEALYRLDRPFIAWQPPDYLPEGSVDVTESPKTGIRFGSFNNNRKLSDQTLRVWGRILSSLPEAQLVLKASANGDQPTQQLLARRMAGFGLDPERVIFLDLTATCEDHLLQYRHIDIALDPFPNGGCTTTFEALWMGCPVITLSGSHYVSRMSTAILSGCGLDAWSVATEDSYVQLAIKQADYLSHLRQNRDHWRHAIVNSPVGDAADLFTRIEEAFASMVVPRQTSYGPHMRARSFK